MTRTTLDQLKTLTTIVADTSDLTAIEKFRPLDATTNPSLITAAAKQVESLELIQTEIMGASFRSIEQVLGLAGCDLLTVAPNLLSELATDNRMVEAQLKVDQIQIATDHTLVSLTETQFKNAVAKDPMASQLLSSGIQGFIQAREQLTKILKETCKLAVEA